MLQFLRRKKSLLMWIISPVIVVSFVFFYGWTGIGTGPGMGRDLMQIGGRTIQINEFYMEERNVENYFRMMYDGELPPGAAEQFNFRRMALNNLMERYFFVAGSEKFRVPVSQQHIRQNIYNMFRGINDFESALQRYLSQTGMSEQGFFSLVEAEVASQAFSDMVRKSGIASSADIHRHLRNNHQKRTIDYVRFRSQEFIDEVEYDEEELVAFFEANQDKYIVPEKYNISYVQFRPQDVRDEVEVSEEQIESYYEINLTRYRESEKRDLKRIFISVEDTEDEELMEEKRSELEEIRRQIVEGEVEFADMAREHSDGPEGERGGDFGIRSRGDLPTQFGRPVFELQEGGISSVLEDRRGLYLYMVQEVIPERVRELDEVRERIKRSIQDERARDLVMDKANELRNEVNTLEELKEYAAEHELEVKESGYFSTQRVPGLGTSRPIFEQVQQLRKNEVGDPVQARNNGIVFGVEGIEDSHVPPLDDIRMEVIEDLRYTLATEKAQQHARNFRRGLRGDYVNFDNMAAEFDKEIKTTEEIRRTRNEVKGIGESREFIRYIFDADLHQIGPVTEMVNEETGEVDTFIVWFCSEIIEPDDDTVRDNWGRAYISWSTRYGNSLRFAMHLYLQEHVPMRILHPELETMLRQ